MDYTHLTTTLHKGVTYLTTRKNSDKTRFKKFREYIPLLVKEIPQGSDDNLSFEYEIKKVLNGMIRHHLLRRCWLSQ